MLTDSVGHVAALPAQLIAEPRELLLPGQVLPAGADPLLARDDSVRDHRRCSFPRGHLLGLASARGPGATTRNPGARAHRGHSEREGSRAALTTAHVGFAA